MLDRAPRMLGEYRQKLIEATAADILDVHNQPDRVGTYPIKRSRRVGRIAGVLGTMNRAKFAQAVGDSVASQTDQDVTVWTKYVYMGDSAEPEQWPANITIGDHPVYPNENMRILWPPEPGEQ